MQRLGFIPEHHDAINISEFLISSTNGSSVSCVMEMGGFGISRYRLDEELCRMAQACGVEILTNVAVQKITRSQELFDVLTPKGSYISTVVIGAYGKRSKVDRTLNRSFFETRTNYVGIKHHLKGMHPKGLVGLHNFEGGYTGVSQVEDGVINVATLTTSDVLNKYQSIDELERIHLSKNPFLKDIFRQHSAIFEQPYVISQIYFGEKQSVEKNILMVGDAAGMVHPLCGNGMAMAIHSAKICAEQVSQFLGGEIDRDRMESNYANLWDKEFRIRLKLGNAMQPLFGKNWTSNLALRTMKLLPGILPKAVALSHGSYIN
jgi:flavin-dependent dehydrogenase